MSRIVWLVSYPKSGNTWLRTFLANFQTAGNEPVDINSLNVGGISSNRRAADSTLGVECSDLTPTEIDRYRPAIYRSIASGSGKDPYIKVHNAYTLNADSEPLFPADITRAAVYLVRNPLDVAVSYAHHSRKTLDQTIARMARETASLAGRYGRLDFQLPQRILSWSGHVLSWLDQRAIPLRAVRYEDMCVQPMAEFTEVVRFVGLEADAERVRRAIDFSSFETLRQQERARGFREKPYGVASFFRRGEVGGWRETLTQAQVERLIEDHGPVMRRFGYLSESGCPQ